MKFRFIVSAAFALCLGQAHADGPAGYTYCAAENATCTFSGAAQVAYGAQTSYNYQSATNSIACTNAVFGDPISGIAKSCYYQLAGGGSSSSTSSSSSSSGSPPAPTALDNMRAKGVAWLVQHQRGDGSWMDGGNLQTHATASALEALVSAGMKDSYPAGAAVSWLLNNNASSTDSVARTIRALRAAGADATSSLRTLEDIRQGLAFGAYRGYSVSMPDTALGIEALLLGGKVAFDYSHLLDTAYASENLLWGFQTSNNGWSYSRTTGTSSDLAIAMSRKSAVIPTAHVMMAYTRFAFGFVNAGGGYWYFDDARPRIQSTIAWLKTVQKISGGFADDADSNGNFTASKPSQVYESALVRQALVLAKTITLDPGVATDVDTMIGQIDNFLIASQATSGSWGEDPLATAVALASLPPTTLVDADGDGLPDVIEQSITGGGSTTSVDPRNLPKGNGSAPPAIGAVSKNFQISAVRNVLFSYTPDLFGTTAPYNFALISPLPKGVALNYTTGALSGQVSTVGEYSLHYSLRDSKGVLNDFAGWLHVVSGTVLDSDGDGIPDWWEIKYGLNPYDASDVSADPDGDGLTNLQEYQHGTNPHDADTDHDGMSDGDEVTAGRNPLFDESKLPALITIINMLLDD